MIKTAQYNRGGNIMATSEWINLLLSVITTLVAILALFQSKQQIRLSNKQHLFDKRIEYYIIAKDFISLYESNQSLLTIENNQPVMEIVFIFTSMTNNTYLEDITNITDHLSEKPYRKNFLKSLETIRSISTKIRFVFNGKASHYLSNFVHCYQEFLMEMYRYQIIIKHMHEHTDRFKSTLEDAQKACNEAKHHTDLQHAITNLTYAYDVLKQNDTEKIIERQIKLNDRLF